MQSDPPERTDPRQSASRRKAMNYSRKRAVTACIRCRARKTKCDNQRPTCGFCKGVSAECRYDEKLEHSSFDPASLHILSRLNQILEKQDDVLQTIREIGVHGNQPTAAGSLPTPSRPGMSDDQTMTGYTEVDEHTLPWEASTNYLKIPSSRTTPDRILSWPIFGGKFPDDYLQEAIFDSADFASDDDGSRGPGQQTATNGIHDLEVVSLTERFLSLAHTKNPILDEDNLRRFAKTIAEDGLSWNGPSCLVLLACALGSIASPFEESHAKVTFDPLIYRQLHLESNAVSLRKAESYYLLARRRIGLLRPSIIASQCFFISGVYLMYSLRPIEAFHEFHQASVVFQMCLKLCRASQKSSKAQRLEQRLYWSCFKSECEILSEVPLPESGISDFEYPHMFPSPPDTEDLAENEVFSEGTVHVSPRQQEQEQSWYYYLSEIALRRIGNRVLNAFYRDDHHSWTNMDVSFMVKVAEDFIQLLGQWHEGLPPILNYNQNDLCELPSEELPYMIRARVLEIRSWIFRPFLFYAIHNQQQDLQNVELLQFAEQALLYSIRLIESSSLRHRHHGVWYTCRVSASAAFCIIAAAQNGTIPLPQEWHSAVQLAIETLSCWEQESPGDLRLARTILEELLSNCTIPAT